MMTPPHNYLAVIKVVGIGGGGVMVPVLTTLFSLQAFPEQHVVHMALATSMTAIVVTALSSLRAHHRHDAVLWPAVHTMAPGIVIGTFAMAFVAARISSRALSIFFVVFMGYVSLQMLVNKQPKPTRQLPNTVGLSLVGLGIGAVSALAAIGGGSLTVPFMTWCNVKLQKAIGTSAAIGLPIALAGTAGYLMSGLAVQQLPDYTIGFIYLPAAISISVASFITAPLGARLTHRLPVTRLRKIFAGLLVVLCLKMLHTVFAF